jgi:acetylornithine deacetylase/succinyl-diaminopimelate desuccinylase-like protein
MAADMRTLAAGHADPRALARLSTNPFHNALVRTTCVATRLSAGHADNALPQAAQAVVNCRLLPGEDPDGVRRTLERVIADPRVTVTALGEALSSPASPLTMEVMGAVTRVTRELWPKVVVVPSMSMGATDGLYLRRAGIPTYGTGSFEDMDDDRAHGKDERIGVRDYDESIVFLDKLVRALAAPPR